MGVLRVQHELRGYLRLHLLVKSGMRCSFAGRFLVLVYLLVSVALGEVVRFLLTVRMQFVHFLRGFLGILLILLGQSNPASLVACVLRHTYSFVHDLAMVVVFAVRLLL